MSHKSRYQLRKGFLLLLSSFLLLCIHGAAASEHHGDEVPQDVSVSGIAYGGSGCPQGTAAVLIAGK
jgi:hypothetical protein